MAPNKEKGAKYKKNDLWFLVKEEYIDDFIEETPVHQVQWSCLEFEDVAGPRRFISFEVGRYFLA